MRPATSTPPRSRGLGEDEQFVLRRHLAPGATKLLVFTRRHLVAGPLGNDQPALLLEGSSPEGTPAEIGWSLDDAIDARFEWIDEEASRLAEQLAEPLLPAVGHDASIRSMTPAWLNALGLRYYLVKLIRLVAYFVEVRPLRAKDEVQLVAARRRDEDYAALMAEICRLAAANLRVTWIELPPGAPRSFPPNGRWRRLIGRLSGLLEPRPSASACGRRVVLCGNPRVLDPVCGELLRRGGRLWWLYDRLALKSWLRWRTAGVGQLVCDSSEARVNQLVGHAPRRLECRGVDLAPPVERWIAERLKTDGPRQTRILEQIDAHFRRIRPEALVLDEDATPMSRAAVGIARRHGATSFVVQHGAPCCRFGFAPPAADYVLVWGRSSEEQLVRWGVPAERIHVVGSPRHECGHDERAVPTLEKRSPRILLVTTAPPRDERPDAVALHLTRRSYAEMLRTALTLVATIPHARLVVKLHPRAPHDPIAKALLSEFPSVKSRVVTHGPVEKWLRRTDCVLSCLSSAGIDATLAGVPVIQLLPPGSGEVLPHEAWGMLGTARSEAELRPLLTRALETNSRPPAGANPNAFADLDRAAAARIAAAVLANRPLRTETPNKPTSRSTPTRPRLPSAA